MRLIFIRHGRTQSNVDHLLDTAFPGAPLDEVGLAQAQALPAKLAHEPIEVVMTSDALRAQQTGAPLARGLGVPLIAHPGVREIFAGDWEMRSDWLDYQGVILSWQTDPSTAMPNGESGYSFFTRFDRAIAELADDDCAAVVSHGAALFTWLAHRGNVEVGVDWRLGNTDTVVVEGRIGEWRIKSWAGRAIST